MTDTAEEIQALTHIFGNAPQRTLKDTNAVKRHELGHLLAARIACFRINELDPAREHWRYEFFANADLGESHACISHPIFTADSVQFQLAESCMAFAGGMANCDFMTLAKLLMGKIPPSYLPGVSEVDLSCWNNVSNAVDSHDRILDLAIVLLSTFYSMELPAIHALLAVLPVGKVVQLKPQELISDLDAVCALHKGNTLLEAWQERQRTKRIEVQHNERHCQVASQ